jgi:hypothetical protein
MQDIEPFPVPLYVLALTRPAFTNDCDDAMRWSPAASRARPFSLSGCSAVCWMLIGACVAVSVGPAIACIDSADELAIVVFEIVQEMAQSVQAAH